MPRGVPAMVMKQMIEDETHLFLSQTILSEWDICVLLVLDACVTCASVPQNFEMRDCGAKMGQLFKECYFGILISCCAKMANT